MKIAIIIAAWIVAATAWAVPQAVWKDGTTRPYWPTTIAWPDGRETIGANAAQCEAAGVARPETKQEQAAREKASADAAKAAQAAAEAEAKAAAEKAASIAAAADYAAAKSKKEEAAKLEAVAAVSQKEPSDKDKLELLWKWKIAELETEK